MLLLSVRGFLDYAGPTVHSRLAWLPCCLPPTRNEVGVLIYGLFAAQWPRPPMPLVYASKDTSRCPLQDSRSGWIRYFLSCRALASPTTCRFIPAHSEFPVSRAADPSDRGQTKHSRRAPPPTGACAVDTACTSCDTALGCCRRAGYFSPVKRPGRNASGADPAERRHRFDSRRQTSSSTYSDMASGRR